MAKVKKNNEEVVHELENKVLPSSGNVLPVEDENEPTANIETKDKRIPKVPESSIANKFCNGTFTFRPATDFTRDSRYSDTYLKSKGL